LAVLLMKLFVILMILTTETPPPPHSERPLTISRENRPYTATQI